MSYVDPRASQDENARLIEAEKVMHKDLLEFSAIRDDVRELLQAHKKLDRKQQAPAKSLDGWDE